MRYLRACGVLSLAIGLVCALPMFAHTGRAFASSIMALPSATSVDPGGSFYVDINVSEIPEEGLGAIQFRLNVDAPGSNVAAISDASVAKPGEISVVTPMVIGQASDNVSGLLDFFWAARGPHGILVVDNETLRDGSAVFTLGHTSGSAPSSGSGSVARIYFSVGKDVAAEKVFVTLSDVMLLSSGVLYPLEGNQGAIVELKCVATVPDVAGLSLDGATAALEAAELILGEVYEIENADGSHPLGQVLEQSEEAGASIQCDSSVNVALNVPPEDVTDLSYEDKVSDESGAVVLHWIASSSADTAGYRIYLGSDVPPLAELFGVTTGEVSGLPGDEFSALRVTAFDTSGNESGGALVSVTPLDDVAPRIAIQGIEDGHYYSADVVYSFVVEDSSETTVALTLNAAPHDGSDINDDGAYSLTVAVTDSAGNSSAEVVGFVIDKTSPVIQVAGVEGGRYYNSDVSVGVVVTDANLFEAVSLLDGEAYTDGTMISSEGRHEIFVSAEDKAGNIATSATVFYVDKTMPASIIEIGEPKLESEATIFVTAATPLVISGYDTGLYPSGVEVLELRVNDEPWSAYVSPFTITGPEDGVMALSYRAIDVAANVEDFHTIGLTLDNTLPETEAAFDGATYLDESGQVYIATESTVILSASDSLSGVSLTEYRVDGGEWTPYTQFTISGEGMHDISFRSTDNLGNVETEQTLAVAVDNTPPETQISMAEPSHVSAEGVVYATGSTAFILGAADVASGVETTKYRIDAGQWTAYSAFTILDEGSHAVEYFSVDHVGNVETTKTFVVVIDNTAPETGISVGQPVYEIESAPLYVGADTLFELNSSDALSGVQTTEYRVDGGAWTPYAQFTISGEGSHSIGYRSVDNVGNIETEQTLAVVVDNLPPVTSIEVSVPKHEDGESLYITSTTVFTLSAVDDFSGVQATEYRVDGGAWTPYAQFTISGEGSHSIGYRSVDNLGNTEAEQILAVAVDSLPPVTSIEVSVPKHEDGESLYITSTTVFTLSAVDDFSGVRATEYRVDGGAWTPYEAFSILNEGSHVISYRSTDNVGSIEAEKSFAVVVDSTSPETSIEVGTPRYADGESLYVTSSTVFALSAADNLSGVLSTEYRVDGGEWMPYASFSLVGEGSHTIGYRSVDNLGNTEAEQTLAVAVDNTPPVTSANFGKQSYQSGGEVLVSSTTTITLSATDSLAGVHETYYRFDDTQWTAYTSPLTLSGLSYGHHELHFYSKDNLENAETSIQVMLVHVGVDVDVSVLNVPRVLVWTEDTLNSSEVRDFLSGALAGGDMYVSIASDKDTFIEGFRSGAYNIIAIMDNKTPLDANVMREIQEAVQGGTGLLVSAWGNNVHPILAETMGIKFVGSKPMDIDFRMMSLLDSPVSAAGELTVYSRILKAELAGGEAAGEIPGDPDKKGNPSQAIPGLVLNNYGKGRTVFVPFDMAGSASYADSDGFAVLVNNIITYLAPTEPVIGAHSTVLLKTSVTVHGAALDVKTMDTLNEGLECLPLFALTCGIPELVARLGDGETASFQYFVRLPDKVGGYVKSTDVFIEINGGYQEFGSFEYTLSVTDDSETLRASSLGWMSEAALLHPTEAGRISGIASALQSLEGLSLNTKAEIESAIKIILGAIQKVVDLGFDASALREMLDEYLRIMEVYHSKLESATTMVESGPSAGDLIVIEISASGSATPQGAQVAPAGAGLEIIKTIPDYPRLLVWVNDGCALPGNVEGCMREDLLAAAFGDRASNFVHGRAEFELELRNSFYTDYVIFGDAETLGDIAERELMEKVFSGRGLISSHWIGSRPDELFGISALGVPIWFDGAIEFIESDVYSAGVLDASSVLMSIEAAEPINVLAYAGSSATVLKNEYGFGKVLYFAYDLGRSLADAQVDVVSEVMRAAADYVHLPDAQTLLYPYTIWPVNLSVVSTPEADVVLNERYPQGMVLIDSMTSLAIAENPKEFLLHVQAGVPASITYFVLIPDMPGTISLVTEADGAEVSLDLETVGDARAIAGNVLAMLDALTVAGKDRNSVREAQRLVARVKDRNVQNLADMEGNIMDLLDAVEVMAALDGTRLVRRETDMLIALWQEYWYIRNLGN